MDNHKLNILKTKTILLVEDEVIIRNNISSMLRYFFKDVFTATNGYEGLEKYEKHLPDLIMTDLKMPFMGGFELLDELKKRSSNSYMIVVSAHTDTELLVNAVNNGIVFTPEYLDTTAGQHVDSAKLQIFSWPL